MSPLYKAHGYQAWVRTVSKQQAAHAHAIFVTRLMQSLARVYQNRASEAKRALVAAGVNTKLYSHDVKLKSSIQ